MGRQLSPHIQLCNFFAWNCHNWHKRNFCNLDRFSRRDTNLFFCREDAWSMRQIFCYYCEKVRQLLCLLQFSKLKSTLETLSFASKLMNSDSPDLISIPDSTAAARFSSLFLNFPIHHFWLNYLPLDWFRATITSCMLAEMCSQQQKPYTKSWEVYSVSGWSWEKFCGDFRAWTQRDKWQYMPKTFSLAIFTWQTSKLLPDTSSNKREKIHIHHIPALFFLSYAAHAVGKSFSLLRNLTIQKPHSNLYNLEHTCSK